MTKKKYGTPRPQKQPKKPEPASMPLQDGSSVSVISYNLTGWKAQVVVFAFVFGLILVGFVLGLLVRL
ncbi:MAG TPA: hypothetical protein VFE62_09635 [Gemmataceae bacterium]|nr:hypothetical protein [Gemmataceae bacterium]